MRQNITKEQWDKLSEEDKWILLEKCYGINKKDEEILYERYGKRFNNSVIDYVEEYRIFGFGECYNPLSIGQMIEFISQHYPDLHIERNEHDGEWGFGTCKQNDRFSEFEHRKELIDILWEVVKHILDNTKNQCYY